MKKRTVLILTSLLTLTVMLTWPLHAEHVESTDYSSGSWRYWVMGGTQNSSSELSGQGVTIGDWSYRIPLLSYWNVTFSKPWFYPGYGLIVNLTVPHETFYTPPEYSHEPPVGWINHTVTMTADGHGWLFLNATGDVDCYTSNNSTGVYWVGPSPMASTKAADPGEFPFPGQDGVAGTADDGFGDGNADPRGSSVLYTKTTVTVHYASEATGWVWQLLCSYDWTSIWATGVAYDVVNETSSGLSGVSARVVGHPWEFLADKDHEEEPGYHSVPHGHTKWNAYVTYASAWARHNIDTALGPLDIQTAETEKIVREDCVIADINCDEIVDIVDIVIAALGFRKYDPRADVADPRGLIDIRDIVRIAINFGWKLTPDCIMKP